LDGQKTSMKIALIVIGVIAALIGIAWLRGRKWREIEREGKSSMFRILAGEYGEGKPLRLIEAAFRTDSENEVYDKLSTEKKRKIDKRVAKELEKFAKDFVKYLVDRGMEYEEALEMVCTICNVERARLEEITSR